MIINPWIYYIVNDEMPDLGISDLGDEYRKKRTWAIIYCFAICILWVVGISLLAEYLMECDADNFMSNYCLLYVPSLALLTFLIIFGVTKILDSDNKKKTKKRNQKQK